MSARLLILVSALFFLPFLVPGSTSGTLALRGAVLPLYSADPTFDYGTAINEIASTGANSVSLTVVLLQHDGRSAGIYAKPGRTVPDDVLRRTIRQAHAAGLEVMLFPMVLLENPGEDDWRGNIAPEPKEKWFADYARRLRHYAVIAREEQCAWLSLGSEQSSMEKYTAKWKELIGAVRADFPGKILYSCNWDHLDGPAEWWNDLDAVGLSSYYELTEDKDAPQEELDAAWRDWRAHILEWRQRTAPDLPIIFTEVGYPSMDGAAVYPWDYTLKNPPDVDEQRRCYQAFISAWHGREEVHGVYFYKWLSFDADDARSYSPRGKPAEAVMRAWFENLRRSD